VPPRSSGHEGLGVVAVVDRGPGRLVLTRLEQLRQLPGALFPRGVGAVEVEARWDTSTSGETQQRDAFIGGRLGGLSRGGPPGSWQIAGCIGGRGLA
jgi:hypothetical protein